MVLSQFEGFRILAGLDRRSIMLVMPPCLRPFGNCLPAILHQLSCVAWVDAEFNHAVEAK